MVEVIFLKVNACSHVSPHLSTLQQFPVQCLLLIVRQDFSLLGETGFHLAQFCSKLTQLGGMGKTEEKVIGNIILPDSSSAPNLSGLLCQTNDEL